MMQKKDRKRNKQMTRKQQEEQKRNMEMPINKFLNTFNEDGTHTYPTAKLIWDYSLANTDPVHNDMRLARSLLHEISWRKDQAAKYLLAHKSKDGFKMYDKNGQVMDKEECYLAHISSNINVHLGLSNLREHLVMQLLPKCDGNVFKFDQYNEFVLDIQTEVKKLGYELFPAKVEVLKV